ncbi:MAG: MFS transporter [Victivallaceae bacterium]
MKGWRWVPTLYFAEGVPYAVVGSVSIVLLKNLNLSNAEIALYSSLLTLPWAIKPLWAPVLDIFGSKKNWIASLEFLMALFFALAALLLAAAPFNALFLALLFALAFVSATHDVAADGFYLIGLDTHGQSFFTGIRSTAYRAGVIATQGGLVMLAGYYAQCSGSAGAGWALAFTLAAAIFALLSLWHFRSLPAVEAQVVSSGGMREFGEAFVTFFQKKHVGAALAFILLYRLGESQLVRLAAPFMLDAAESGGLGFSTLEQGLFYGTIGVAALLAGGVLGGVVISRDGFGRWAWPMALAINLPNLLYVYLAAVRPSSRMIAGGCVAVEQFGYGFGFTLYMLFMVAFAEDSGKYRTSHFALMTGFMMLGMMIPGMAAGYIQGLLGSYVWFFVFVMVCTLPGFAVTALGKRIVPADFGRPERAAP